MRSIDPDLQNIKIVLCLIISLFLENLIFFWYIALEKEFKIYKYKKYCNELKTNGIHIASDL